nr:hypothetical protein [Tanacetum cinerariifolium]
MSRLKKHKKDDRDERLLLIFKQIHINMSFLKAMTHMPKGAKVLKDLLSHKEKLKKAASSVKLSEECLLLFKGACPQKEGDPRSFTLPCLIEPLAVKNALADLRASINLMPHSLLRRLRISNLKPTKVSIQLGDQSIKYPIGVCENILVKISKFIFPVDFVVLEMDEDDLVPIILGRPFLATSRAIIDIHEGKPSLRVESETVTFNIRKSMKSKHSRAIAWSIADIKGIDSSFNTHKIFMEDEFKPSVQPQRRVNPNIKEVVPKKRGMTVVKNDKDELISQRTMLERMDEHEYYYFLYGFSGYFQIPIAPKDQEKTTFTCLYGTFAYKRMSFGLCNSPATFQRCMTVIFHELIEDSMEQLIISPDSKPDLGKLTRAEIRDLFPKERLMAISNKNDELCNYGVTCEDEAKRRNFGTKMKTFKENCYLLLYAVFSKEDTSYQCQLITRIRVMINSLSGISPLTYTPYAQLVISQTYEVNMIDGN